MDAAIKISNAVSDWLLLTSTVSASLRTTLCLKKTGPQ